MAKLEVGKKVKLSDVKKGGVIRINRMTAIVKARYPERWVSGGTTLTFANGQLCDYNWDYKNPEVTYLGQGKLVIKIVMDPPKGKRKPQ